MKTIKSCEFNIDTACIDIVYTDGKMLSLYIPSIEESLRTTARSRSRLDLMLDNEPLEYAQMVIDGTMQDYLDQYEKSSYDCESGIRKSLEQKFSTEIARQITQEMMMCG